MWQAIHCSAAEPAAAAVDVGDEHSSTSLFHVRSHFFSFKSIKDRQPDNVAIDQGNMTTSIIFSWNFCPACQYSCYELNFKRIPFLKNKFLDF